ncbi:MAG: phosphoribosylamine--glycine ligase [Pyramidobacter sp.]|nr:phosphoribosylamine--glycine ligase [Pyramidobacter sp.]
MSEKLNVLVLGSGGREHAIIEACSRSPRLNKLFAIPGNPGIAAKAECFRLNAEDGAAVADFCKEHAVDLVIVGPEAPLAAGVADVIRAAGVAVFGPSKAGAMLEASKEFSKNFMARHNVPTAKFFVCRTVDEAEKALAQFEPPYIVKASGLAAGKGVFVEPTLEGARSAVQQLLVEKKLGSAGDTLVIEEALPGRELSLMVITDTKDFRLLSTSQDHKRLKDGDEGPNTGGMGAYAPAPWVSDDLMTRALREVIEPSVAALRAEGLDYRGVLYVGLMIAPDGTPKVLEYNVRLGDPETEVLLPLFEGDWVDLCWHVAHGDLASFEWKKETQCSLCVICASGGYPTGKSAPAAISGLEAANAVEGVTVYHCGTSDQNGTVMATGGRVLCVSAVAPSLEQAKARAYEAVSKISFDGMQYRRDIGHQVFDK